MVRKFLEDIFRRKLDVLHSARVVHTLYQQQKQGKYCDLKVLVEERQYFVHRCVLASASAELDAQINGLDTIQLVGVTNYGFECLLEILYSGKLSKVATVDSARFHQIISAADALNAESVIEYCARERSDLMKLVIDQADHANQGDIDSVTPTTAGLSEMSVPDSMAVDSPVTDLENAPSTIDATSDDASPANPSHSIVPDVFASNSQVKAEVSDPGMAEEVDRGLDWIRAEAKEENLQVDERVAAEVEVADGTKVNEANGNTGGKYSPPDQTDQDTPAQLEPANLVNQAPVYSSVTSIHALEPGGGEGHVKPVKGVRSGSLAQTVERIQSNRLSLLSGMSSMHRGVKCTICKRTFSSSHHLRAHMKKHTGPGKPFRCEVCGMRFSFQMTLTNHMKLHDLKKHICEVCGKDFKLSKNLHAHMQHAHPEEMYMGASKSPYSFPKSFSEGSSRRKTVPMKLAVGGQDIEESEPDEIYPPDKSIAHSSSWDMKLNPVNELENLKKSVENVQVGRDGKYECPLCNKGFSRRWNLKCHVLTHSENHQSRRQAVKMPVRKEPPKPHVNLPFQCPDCGKGFGNLGNLRKHATVLHPYSQAVEAVYAGNPFLKQTKSPSGSASQLSPQLSCWCDICGRGFRRLRNLRSHMETHTGSGYECHICGRTFAQKDGLNGHLWVHGGMTGSKSTPTDQEPPGPWERGPPGAEGMG